ncbi:MAG: CPBP family intramembrane glutamic endopeptidase [Ferruginibacter sp.]
MIGLLVALAASWLLFWLFERKHLSPLGLTPYRKRIGNFLVGLIASVVVAAVYFLFVAAVTKSSLSVNKEFTAAGFFSASWWVLKSVLFEEFLFRGALLYIAIKKLGIKWGCILSAIAFGIYHWFSYNVFGEPTQMIFVFIVTVIAGLMFAYAYAITKSLYLPIGLHLGWNLVTIVVFSQGPLGQQLLISANGHKAGGIISLALFAFQVLVLPLITYWYLRRTEPLTKQ